MQKCMLSLDNGFIVKLQHNSVWAMHCAPVDRLGQPSLSSFRGRQIGTGVTAGGFGLCAATGTRVGVD